jgi:hypothetical protein
MPRMSKKKRPGAREESRKKQNTTGANSRKSRPDVPATAANKSATGKRV